MKSNVKHSDSERSYIVKTGNLYQRNFVRNIGGKLRINPPPSDICCERCRRHLSALMPFGKDADFGGEEITVLDSCEGVLLVKRFRFKLGPIHLSDEVIIEPSYDDAEKKKLEKLGMFDTDLPEGILEPSWECKDCYFQDDDLE